MGNTDSIPVVSQTKTIVQIVCCDAEGAVQTQENFLKECPVVSQLTSTVQLIAGDAEGALETQKRFWNAILNMVDGIPVVGHLKGVVHYTVGDKQGGDRAMKNATRTTGVIAGGVGGFLVGGRLGAVVGGIYGGATVDIYITIATGQSSGYIAQVENIIKNPKAGNVFDTVFMPVADGFAGYGAGKLVNNIKNAAIKKANLTQANALEAEAVAALENGKMSMSSWEYLKQANKAKDLFRQAQQLKDNGNVQANLKHGTTSLSISGSLATAQVRTVSSSTVNEKCDGGKNKSSSKDNESSSSQEEKKNDSEDDHETS